MMQDDAPLYSTQLGEQMEEWLLCQPLEKDQLVWVCKSKGLKKKTKKALEDGNQHRQEPFLRGTILSLDTETNDEDVSNDPRITVRYPKGSTYRVRKSHLWPILVPQPNTAHVLVWSETNVYRRCCIQHTMVPHDFFVEVGCDYGITVAKVAATAMTGNDSDHELQKNPHLLGIDKSTESIGIANDRYPHLNFVQWDILDEAEPSITATDTRSLPKVLQYLLSQQRREINLNALEESDSNPSLVVAIDINGNRELEAVQACLAKIQAMWQPRLIIVKSRAFHQQIKSRQIQQ